VLARTPQAASFDVPVLLAALPHRLADGAA
jgi:hypothetical protein